MALTRISIVEDDRETRERLVELLSKAELYEIEGVFGTVSEASKQLPILKPDVLLLDLGLPDGSGIELITQVREKRLDTLALVISGFHDEHRVFEALEAGAKGYILKHEEEQNVLKSIATILDGGAPISPTIAKLMLNRFSRSTLQIESLPEHLTERQLKILKFLSQGFTAKEISEKLTISYYTVTTHIKNIYEKLQVNSRIEALIEAKKIGYL
jgi:DNA-binding NarL/FixJ family response regulator